MPNELNIALATTGLTVTAQRYQAGAAVGSAISCPETGSTGFNSGNMTGTAGTYQLAFLAAGANVGSGSIVWDGTAEATSSAPSVVQIRTEMDANSTKLANLDATISSRLSPSGTLATVTTLTNAPTVPTATAIASQVRTELSVELGRVDQSISSRLAGSAYTAPANSDIAAVKAKTDNLPASPAAVSDIPSANIAAIKAKTDALPASPAATGDIPTESEIAAEVWAKPTTELTITGSIGERAKNQSTVSTTGAQLAAALS